MVELLPFPQRPMTAAPVDSLPHTDGLPGGAVYEPKFDGQRALLFVDGGTCRIHSRRGTDITSAFPEIAAAAVQWLPGGVVLDGEIVIWGIEAADFGEFQRRLSGQADVRSLRGNTVSFVAFDVLAGAGMDLRASPLRVRRHALDILLEDALPPLHMVPQTRIRDQAYAWLTSYAESHVGIEGVVAKGMGTPYRPDTTTWLKLRIHESAEFLVWAVTGDVGRPTTLALASPDGVGGLRHISWTTTVSARESLALGRSLAGPGDAHPWAGVASTAGLPGWDGPPESLLLVDPRLVVEVASGADLVPTFVRQRPDLQVEDLDGSSDALGDYLRQA